MSRRTSFELRKFQIWSDCEKNGWDRSSKDIGDSIGCSSGAVNITISKAGWTGRIGDKEKSHIDSVRSGTMARYKEGKNVDENDLDLTDLMKTRQ